MSGIIPSDVAIVGITYAKKWYAGRLKSIKHTDKIRGDLQLYSLKFAAGVGYRIVIVDGGSAKTFIKELKKINGLSLLQAKIPKRSPNRRKAIFKASTIGGVKAIVMTEIEKTSVITDCVDKIVEPIINGEADLVLPKREQELFKKTVPDYMYESENEGNFLYNEALRSHGLLSAHQEDLDVFFGVRVFRNDPQLLKTLLSKYESNPFDSLLGHKLFDVEEYSNAQFFPVVRALQKKLKVVSVTIPFLYPKTQMENESKGEREIFVLKRRFQRLTILVELMHFLGYINGEKSRKLTKTKIHKFY